MEPNLNYLNLNVDLTVFGFFVNFLPFFPFDLLVGVSLRLRDVVSVFVVLDRLITSSCMSQTKSKIPLGNIIVFLIYWIKLTLSSPE